MHMQAELGLNTRVSLFGFCIFDRLVMFSTNLRLFPAFFRSGDRFFQICHKFKNEAET